MNAWAALFILFFIIYGAVVLVWWNIRVEKRRKQIVSNLTSNMNLEGTVRTTVLIEKPNRAAGLAGFFKSGRAPSKADNIDKFSKIKFLLLTLLGAFAGFVAGTHLVGVIGVLAPVIGAIAGGSAPKMWRSKHRDKRLAAIESQFPDALDFLARSVRAGNAFSIALELLAAEASEPTKTEIVRVSREIALGAGLDDALRGLIARLPLLEVRMFVAAVLLQRETGGNLSEVLSKLAMSVRERLRLRGQVKAASGQGRLTAMVLTFLPVVTMVALEVVSPDYIGALTGNPIGRNLLGAAVVSQILGYLVMQKMIKVEV